MNVLALGHFISGRGCLNRTQHPQLGGASSFQEAFFFYRPKKKKILRISKSLQIQVKLKTNKIDFYRFLDLFFK